MMMIRQYRIYRMDLKNNPDILYIFGDNLNRVGHGGQAGSMRGEPNAFGIATKRSVSHNYPNDYFFDTQNDVTGIIDEEFRRLIKEIQTNRYKAMIVPLEGIGTGLSRLPEFAPELLKYIEQWFETLKNL